MQAGRDTIYLQANDEHFSYTVKGKYTGCFFGHDNIKSAEDAMNELVRMRDNEKKFGW